MQTLKIFETTFYVNKDGAVSLSGCLSVFPISWRRYQEPMIDERWTSTSVSDILLAVHEHCYYLSVQQVCLQAADWLGLALTELLIGWAWRDSSNWSRRRCNSHWPITHKIRISWDNHWPITIKSGIHGTDWWYGLRKTPDSGISCKIMTDLTMCK